MATEKTGRAGEGAARMVRTRGPSGCRFGGTRLSRHAVEAEKAPLFAGFQHQAGLLAEGAHLFHTVDPHVAVARQIDHRQLDVVEKPPGRGGIRRHVPEDQPAAGAEDTVDAVEKGLDVGVVAEFIQSAVGGDLFQVETVKEYPKDYYQCIEEAQAEGRANARPELKAYLDSLEGYDNIFVCGPIWWGTYPMAVFTQLEKLDWTGKKVMPLTTHEGSGLASCERDLKKTCKGAKVSKGLAVHGADAAKSEKTVAAWAKKSIG